MNSLVNKYYDKSIKKAERGIEGEPSQHSIWVRARPLPSYFPPSDGKTRLEFARPPAPQFRSNARVSPRRPERRRPRSFAASQGSAYERVRGAHAQTRLSSCTTAGKHTGRAISKVGHGNCFLNMPMILKVKVVVMIFFVHGRRISKAGEIQWGQKVRHRESKSKENKYCAKIQF